MPIHYINTGTAANKGNGDTLRLAFTKINQNFLTLEGGSKDQVGEVISNPAKQSGISVTYDPLTQYASFAVNIAGPNTLGAVKIGGGIALNSSTGLISVFDGNYNNLANIPQALGTTDTPTFANLHITGNVDIAGTSTIINSTVVTTDDLTLTLANNSVSALASNGAGIIVNGPTVPASITYNGTTDSWTANKTFTAPNISIGGNNVVTANQLGNITFSTNVIGTLNDGEDLVLTPNNTGTLVLNKINTLSAAGTIYQGTAYDSVEYTDTSIRVDADTDSFAQMIMQNHSAGLNASTDLVIMNDQGDSFNNIIDLGINSSNYSQTAYGVTSPGDGYLFTQGGNLVIGTQSPNKSIIFHAGGTTVNDSAGSLDQYAWTFNRRVKTIVYQAARLDFLVQNTSPSALATSYFEARNDADQYSRFGINSSGRTDGNILPGETFLYADTNGGTLHIGNHSAINFYTDTSFGYAGAPTLRLETVTGNAILDGNLLPYESETYNLGASTATWNTVYLSTVSNVSFGSNQLAVDITGAVTVNSVPILGEVTVQGTIISSSDMMGPLIIENNGATVFVSLYPNSDRIEVSGQLVSSADNYYSLGSPYLRWHGVWVGSDGVKFNDGSTLTSANGLGGGNATVVVNSTGTVANTGTLWYDTVGGRLYVGYDNTFVDASPAPILDLSTVTQSIIPGADLTYDLGSPTQQWRSLYVGTATIYIGGVPISVDTTTNTLQVGAVNTTTVTSVATEAFVLSQTTSSLVNRAYAAVLGTDGKLTIPSELSSEVGTGDVVINANDGTLRTWTFGSDGGLTFPIGNKLFGDEIVTSDYSGDTVIHGNQHITGNLQVDGVFTFTGTATVISVSSATFYGNTNGFGAFYAGVVGYTPLPVTVMQASADYNDYVQNNFQNLNNGVAASTEWVATADNGNDTNNYIDMGIASSQWNGSQSNSVGTAAGVNDSWIYVQGNTSSSVGGNLIVGTIKDGKSVKILTGSTGSSSIVATFNGRNVNATTTNTGALQVVGGVGISQNLYAGTIYSNDGYFRGPAGYGSIQLASGGALYADSIVLNGAGTIKGPAGYLNITLNSGWNTAVRFTSTATVAGTADATSSSTGALIVSGGAGIAKNVYVGGTVTANKFVGDGSSLTNVTVNIAGNILGTGTNVSLVAGSYTYTFDNGGTLTIPAAGGNEGAEIDFGKAPNSTLSGTAVVVDQYVDRIRVFENSGTNRGVYIDLTQAGAGVSTLLNNRVTAFVNSGTYVTMDNIRATVATSGNRGLVIAAVSTTFVADVGATYGAVSGGGGASANNVTYTTTPGTSAFGWAFFNAGDTATYTIHDLTNSRAYRITLQIGTGYLNNMISIERLI
jgi:hypothetical protein